MIKRGASAGDGRPRYFYGWVIVAVMAATGAVSMGMGSLNFGLFIKPMGDELGIGRAAFGWAQTARQGASSATSPLIGWLLDRYGSRVMLPVAALATGCALIGLAYITSAWHLVVLFVVMGLVGMSGPGATCYDGSGVEVVREEPRQGGGVCGIGNPDWGITFHSVDRRY